MSPQSGRSTWVPSLTSAAGSCLTLANWQESGVQAISLRLEDLLMKPGLAILQSLDNLRQYIAWPGLLILNASLPKPDREGMYRLRSVYDGASIRLDVATLFDLVVKLQPDRVVLPAGSASYYQTCWQHLPPDIVPWWHVSDSQSDGCEGYYFRAKSAENMALVDTEANPCFIQADLGLTALRQLMAEESCLVESDVPAREAVAGLVYSDGDVLSLLDPAMEHDHQPIDAQCTCPTCSQSFTRAYLHHLLQHTPLLAERYLVMHNSHYVAHEPNSPSCHEN